MEIEAVIYSKQQDTFFVETKTGSLRFDTFKELIKFDKTFEHIEITIVNYY